MKFRRNFKKITWGRVETEAKNEEEAQDNYEIGDYEEFDNKSDYELEDWECDKHAV